MANKQLTAKVKLNITDVESKLSRLNKLFNNLDNATNKVGNSNKINRQLDQANNKTNNVVSKVKSWANAQKQVTANARSTNGVLGSIGGKLKSIAATYLGVMGAKAVVNTADTITSAENRLNALNGGDVEATQLAMDKMYVSAQKVRMEYADMIANASKSMTLAGDAFQGNMDNAIRFQEIMAEAYTLGGAQPGEISSSMYQMIQALGAGVLAGDELRSVREGAPLAYKEIEKFAQKTYNTTESLKELASQGKITSDMVVAAVMDAGTKLDEQFENTQITFGQAWNKIKNTAIKAFEPVLQKLAKALDSDAVQASINGLANVFLMLATALNWLMSVFSTFFNWCAENWYWLKYVVIGVVAALIAYAIYYTAVTIAQALVRIGMWIAEHWAMLAILAVIGLLVAGIIWLANTTVSGCEFMIYGLLMVAAAIVLIGLITGSTALVVIGIVVAVVALFIMFAQQIIGTVYWIGAVCANVGLGIANAAIALWNSIKAIATNIGVAFENAWIGAQNAFWTFVSSCLKGLQSLASPINALAKLFGFEGFDLSSTIANVEGKKKSYKSYVSVGNAWSSGINTYEYKNLSDAYSKGAKVGANIQNAVGNVGSSIKNKVSGLSLDNIGGSLGGVGISGDNMANAIGSLPNVNDPKYGVGDAYNAPSNDELLKGVGNIDDNTGSIKDSMDLTEEDLDYLRRIADMEWKKEYTTASIVVDMTNNNTITKEVDADGFWVKLSETLKEELEYVANGVYA